MAYDWSQFAVHTYIDKPLPDVFRMWTTAAGLEKFFIKKAVNTTPAGTVRSQSDIVSAGDAYAWDFMHDFHLDGAFTEVIEDSRVTFTFGPMMVTVRFRDTDSGTLVRLRQYEIPADSEEEKAANHLNCRSCWVFFMTNLKSVMEHGADVRESDPDRSDCIAIHFQPLEKLN